MHRCGLTALRTAVALAALAVLAGPALAAEEGGKHEPNLLEPRFDLGLWSIVIFVLLFAVLYKFAWGPILQGLRKRENDIHGAVNEAKRVNEEMAKQRAAFERQIADANQQIPKLMEEARRAAERLKEEMRAQAMADIQAERQRLRREMDTARDQALKEIMDSTANLATIVSERAIRKSLTDADHRRLVDEALNEIQQVSKQQEKTAAALAEEWVRQGGGKA
jgi:F-type H+-transporting ATPase subunit b